MTNSPILHVNIGEIGLAAAGETLQTILGSCVGIGLLWPAKNVYGLAHCLLPRGLSDVAKQEAKFVDQGVRCLVEKMQISRTDRKFISAVLAGGASMLDYSLNTPMATVGLQNIYEAKKALQSCQIKIMYEDCGHNYGRQLFIYGQDGSFKVLKILKTVS